MNSAGCSWSTKCLDHNWRFRRGAETNFRDMDVPRMKSRDIKQDVFSVLLLCVLAAFLWQFRLIKPATVSFDMWLNGDELQYYYQMSKQIFGRVAAGEMPLWNPYQLSGLPLMATGQVGLFYPLNWFYLFLPTERAMQIVVFLHFILAGALAYALGRALELDRVPSLVAGIVYPFSGFMIAAHHWPNELATIAWYPAIFAAVARIHRGGGPGACAALAASVAMMILACHVAYASYALNALALYALFNGARTLSRKGAKALIREWAWVGTGLALGFILTAPQLLPTMELVSHAVRGPNGLTDSQLEPFGRVPGFLFDHPHNSRVRIGAIAIFMLLPGLFVERLREETAFFLAIAVIAFLLAFGSNTPLYEIYKALPGGRLFRAPERYFSVVDLASAAAAALGAQAVLSRPSAPRRSSAVAAIVAACFTLWIISTTEKLWLVPALLLLIAAIYAPRRAVPLAGVAILALTYANLFVNAKTEAMQLWRPAALRILTDLAPFYKKLASQQGIQRVLLWPTNLGHYPALTAKQAAIYGVYNFQEYDQLVPRRFADYVAFAQSGKLYQQSSSPFAGSFGLSSTIPNARMLGAAGVTQVITLDDSRPPGDRFRSEPIVGALPRAYLVHGIRVARESASTLGAIATGDLNLTSEVILESLPVSAEVRAAPADPDESVRISRYTSETVEIVAVLNRAGVVVLLDTDFPGWIARVNGQSAPIYNANFLFRGLLLPAGVHYISFHYEPQYFKAGLALGCAGIAGLAALMGFAWARGRRRSMSPLSPAT
jgi:hypothetical protein